ncbi:MAG: HDOD domain-containing protein [Rhodothermaceae bacterium]
MNDFDTGNNYKLKNRADRVLSSISNLPTIPYVVFEVTKVIDNPSASAAQLAKIINKDQGLVTKILTVANSPLYGIPRRVSTIDFAIVILGFNHIKNIVIALSMMDAMKSASAKNFNQKQYWRHSLVVATAAKRLADDLGYPHSGEVFTAGLLHDLGIPIIHKYFKKEYDNIVRFAEDNSVTYREAEVTELGLSHEEIGKILMERWNLPENLSEVVEFHHNLNSSPQHKTICALVHLADFMTQKLQIGDFFWDEGIELNPDIIKILNLGDMEYLDKLMVNYKSLFEEQINNLDF